MTSITAGEAAASQRPAALAGRGAGPGLRAEVLTHLDCQASPVAADPDDPLRPIFQQAWWLQAAQEASSYREVRVYRDGRCLGRFPFGLRRRLGIVALSDAEWTHLGGPILVPGLTAEERLACLEVLIRHLPRSTFHVFVAPGAADAGELQAVAERHGYAPSLLTTYVRRPERWADLSEPQARERILQGFSRRRRMHIRQAERRLSVRHTAPADFVAEYEANLPSRYEGLRKRPLASARRLLEAALQRGQARILTACSMEDEGGPCFEAALACVWDAERYYFWMSTRRMARPEGRKPHPDAIKLLALHALAHAQHLGLIFDTDGAVTPGAQRLYADILGLGDQVEHRHVFERHTLLSAIYFSRTGSAVKAALTDKGPPARSTSSVQREPPR